MKSDKKLELLQILKNEAEPQGLKDILNKLDDKSSERSVRRWLDELQQEGLITKEGKKRGTKYFVLSENGTGQKFSQKSLKAIKQVKKAITQRMPIAYLKKWVDSYKPNITHYIPLELRLKLWKMGKRSKDHEPAGTYAHKIYDRLLIDLSYNSSRLEGNTYSLLDTKKLLLEGKAAEGKLDEESIMILNHKEAIRYLVDSARKLTISKETIFTLHYLLSEGLIDPEYSGKIRNHGVRIGGSTYIPFEDRKALALHLDRILEKGRHILDPFEQSFFLLVHISYLQAFADVNKRTARLSANIPLVISNLVPLSFNDVNKDDYISAMIAIYELQNVYPLVDIYFYSYSRTCSLYDSTIKAIGFDEVRVRYRQERRDIMRHIIENELINSKMVSYIESKTKKLIPKKDRGAFLEDVAEDLELIDISRIAGLGITPTQLKTWLKLSGHNRNQ